MMCAPVGNEITQRKRGNEKSLLSFALQRRNAPRQAGQQKMMPKLWVVGQFRQTDPTTKLCVLLSKATVCVKKCDNLRRNTADAPSTPGMSCTR